MKTIVFIGTNKSGSSYEALKASEKMLYYTVLLTDQVKLTEQSQELPHAHLIKMCNINNIDDVRNAVNELTEKSLDIQAIVSFIEPHCHTAALLAREFGLESFSAEAISIMLDKIESRKRLSGSPFASFFYVIDNNGPI